MDKKRLRKMDKKLNICAFVLALLLLVPLTGCGGASNKAEPAGTQEQTSADSVRHFHFTGTFQLTGAGYFTGTLRVAGRICG